MVTRLENGGAQRQTLQIVRELPRDRFDVALAYGPGGFLDAQAESIDDLLMLPVQALQRDLGVGSDLRALFELRSILGPDAKARPVILHTHSSKAGVVGRTAGLGLGLNAVVHTVHGFGFHAGGSARSRRVLMGVERTMRRASDWILTVSEADRNFGIERGLIDREKSSVIRSGIDVAAFERQPEAGAAFRAELGIPEGAPVIGTVACFKPQKAPEDHIAAFAAFLEGQPEAHFIWVGDGEGRPPIEAQLAAQPDLAARVHLIGWSDRIVDLLSALDIFLLISRWEGLPRSLLEARAAGVPCVVSDICGNPEAIGYGRHGVVVPVDRPDLAAQALAELWIDPARRSRIRGESHDNLDAFDARHVTPMHVELYEQLLAR